MRKFIFFSIAFFIHFLVGTTACAFEVPRVDGIQWLDSRTVQITWSVMETSSLAGNATCNTSPNCSAGIGVRAVLRNSLVVYSAAGGPSVQTYAGEPLSSAAARFIAKYGRGGVFNRPSATDEYSNYCGSFVTASSTNTDDTGRIAPWAPCVNIPVIPVSCNYNTQSLTISYGNLPQTSVSGAKGSTAFSVTCTKDALIKFTLNNGSDSINLGRGITAKLDINGSAINTRKNIPGGVPTFLTLGSTLSASNPTPGAFSGSAVMYIDFL